MTTKKEDTELSTAPAPIYPIVSSGRADVQAIIDLLDDHLRPRIIDVTPAQFGMGASFPVLLVPEKMRSLDLSPIIQALRGRPDRRKGTAKVEDLDSLIAHANRHKDAHSVIFADPTRGAPKLSVIFNYNIDGHDTPEGPTARFGDHRTLYAPRLSDEYQAWSKVNDVSMSQSEFAEFIEDRITDITPPPDFDGEQREYNAFLKEFSDLIGGRFASPSRMLELSRGMQVNVEAKFKQALKLDSGESQFIFEEQHTDGKGEPMKVPNLFLIAIPIFYNGPHFRIPVRLRYRPSGGTVKWAFEIYRIDRAFDAAFADICATAKAQTELPLFLGTPEV